METALKLTLISVRPGATHHAVFDDLVSDYLKRCGRDLAATARVFRTEKNALDWFKVECTRSPTRVWLADAGGLGMTSEQFAKRVGDTRDSGTRHLIVAVGPADGWSESARDAADLRVSLGAMTLPHELARLVLVEQIYRAVTILQGHPYHKGH